MGYNKRLEDLIDHHFVDRDELVKNKQMDGVGWLINGNMCCGVYEDLLVARTDPSIVDSMLKKPDIHLFSHQEQKEDMFLSFPENIYRQPIVLHKILYHCLKFTSTLPPKNVAKIPSP